MKTVFQTYEGVVIYTSSCGTDYARIALNRAAVEGFASLVAVLPDGRTYDYTDLLRRDYLPKFSHLKQAA